MNDLRAFASASSEATAALALARLVSLAVRASRAFRAESAAAAFSAACLRAFLMESLIACESSVCVAAATRALSDSATGGTEDCTDGESGMSCPSWGVATALSDGPLSERWENKNAPIAASTRTATVLTKNLLRLFFRGTYPSS